MLFNSNEFLLLFLPVTLWVYFFILRQGHNTGSRIFLIAASIIFYGYWNPAYIPLLLMAVFVNYHVGAYLVSPFNVETVRFNFRKILLVSGISFNILFLGYYKYTNFILETVYGVFSVKGSYLDVILPIGISFFTFQNIAYLVDCYRQEAKVYGL